MIGVFSVFPWWTVFEAFLVYLCVNFHPSVFTKSLRFEGQI